MVIHRSEKVVLKIKNANLLKKLVSHEELLGGSGDVSVPMLKSHASKSSLLNLDGHSFGEVQIELGLLTGVDSWVHRMGEDVETLVSYFINHFILY